jgi:ABC-type multidrug transport system fused ATPase/permease subunit
VSRDAIERAARQAHADAFIRATPKGYETQVSEMGASLSGGQRQRIAIARAILRDPAILIMDEATSQVDAESEEEINRAIRDFSTGRTVLVIAHRLSTVLSAHRIVVMDGGRIVDSGRHAELFERCETYRRLARTQLVGEPESLDGGRGRGPDGVLG